MTDLSGVALPALQEESCPEGHEDGKEDRWPVVKEILDLSHVAVKYDWEKKPGSYCKPLSTATAGRRRRRSGTLLCSPSHPCRSPFSGEIVNFDKKHSGDDFDVWMGIKLLRGCDIGWDSGQAIYQAEKSHLDRKQILWHHHYYFIMIRNQPGWGVWA